MKNTETFENITIEKLIFWGKWLATAPDGRKIIITWGCIPGSIIDVRILKARKSHYEGQELRVRKKSPMEVDIPEGFQLYGGAKWLTIGYDDQLKIKEWQVWEAFYGILKWLNTSPDSEQDLSTSPEYSGSARDDNDSISPFSHHPTFHPIVPSPEIYGYRNKVEFSWGKYISDREGIHDEFRFGFHAQGQFDRIIDCTYCALADIEINAIFHDVDRLSRDSWLPTYDPKRAEGFWRHFVVRKGKKTGEIMLIFSMNGLWDLAESSGQIQDFFTQMVRQLTEKYKSITSVYFLENTGRADIVTGNPVLLFGSPSITEELLWLTFEIQPKSFFQVNTLCAEKLYTEVIDSIQYKGWVLLDLYAGTGTIGILLSKYFEKIYSVELVADASADGEKNADRNGITNVEFVNAKVEDFAQKFSTEWGQADTIVIDPPRDGMHPSALPNIISFGAREIIYVSCNPATLARDLEFLIGKMRDEKTEKLPKYRITDVIPVDMFPHTHHIETVVRMERVG